MLQTKDNGSGRLIGLILVTLALALSAVTILLNRQFIRDQLTYWQYEPTTSVAAISDRVGLSDSGRFSFYISQPEVNTATDFNDNCQRQEAENAILGCYSDGKIYIFDVQNMQLDGVEEVTAAHETLHAAWDRMSSSEKTRVGVLLEEAYARLNNEELNVRMAYYGRTEPGERLNELHSIIGTEFGDIGDELEAHYRTYFTDRAKVLALYNNYESVFKDLKQRSTTLKTELESLSTDLNADIAQYNADAAQIQSDSAQLKSRSSYIDRTDVDQVTNYNNAVDDLRVRYDELVAVRSDLDERLSAYNAKVAEYNKLIVTTNDLTKSLDSAVEPAPSL